MVGSQVLEAHGRASNSSSYLPLPFVLNQSRSYFPGPHGAPCPPHIFGHAHVCACPKVLSLGGERVAGSQAVEAYGRAPEIPHTPDIRLS